MAVPSKVATGEGSIGASGTTIRPAGVSSVPYFGGDVGRDDRRGLHADDLGGPQGAAGSFQTRFTAVPFGQHQHQRRRVVGRGEVAVQERLEVPIGRRDPGALLDLQDELTAGGPVGAGRDHEDGAGGPELARYQFGDRRAVHARLEQIAEGGPERRVDRPLRQVCPDRNGGNERADVADRVAPALVELFGLDDDIRQACTRRSIAHGDDGRPRPGVLGGRQGRIGRRRAALMRHPDDQAAPGRIEGELERLGYHRFQSRGVTRCPDVGRADGLAQDLDDALCRMLGRSAAGEHDWVPGTDRGANRPCQFRGSAPRCGVPLEDPLRERRLGIDHLGHVEGRRPARAWL